MKTQLTTSQAKDFVQRIRPVLRFLCRCRQRFDAAGYGPSSSFYTAVSQAYDTVYALCLHDRPRRVIRIPILAIPMTNRRTEDGSGTIFAKPSTR